MDCLSKQYNTSIYYWISWLSLCSKIMYKNILRKGILPLYTVRWCSEMVYTFIQWLRMYLSVASIHKCQSPCLVFDIKINLLNKLAFISRIMKPSTILDKQKIFTIMFYNALVSKDHQTISNGAAVQGVPKQTSQDPGRFSYPIWSQLRTRMNCLDPHNFKPFLALSNQTRLFNNL